MKLWLGLEEEGKYRGMETLFVGDYTVTYEEIIEIRKQHIYNQLYFGAGQCTPINQEVVMKCLRNICFCGITIEIDIKDLYTIKRELLQDERINWIITITHDNFSYINLLYEKNIQIKIQSLVNEKYISLGELDTFKEVNAKKLQGKKYKGDVVIK
jgi:hypothetical protein